MRGKPLLSTWHGFRGSDQTDASPSPEPQRPVPDGGPGKPPPEPQGRGAWLWTGLLLAMLLSWGLSLTLFQVEQVRTDVSYTYFKQQVAVGNVEWVSTQADTIRGTFREAVPYPPDAGTRARSVKEFSTTVPAFADPGLETWAVGVRG